MVEIVPPEWAAKAKEPLRAGGLYDFLGRWQVKRTIVDRKAKAAYRFSGEATIDASTFVESGMIAYGETLLKSERTYNLRSDEEGLDILFSDGRLFVRLGMAPAQRVFHLCGEDNYVGRFFFEADGTWAEFWQVNGPRKNYTSIARYSRS
jgi:hypothetical protein